MLITVYILFVLILGAIFYQDLKDRAVHWSLFLLASICGGYIFYASALPILVIGANIAFVLILLAGLSVYLFLKEKRIFNLFRTHLGIGDVLFFVAITPLFEPNKFVIFFISGMLLSAVVHLIVAGKNKEKSIPLAGYLSVYLSLLLGLKFTGIFEAFYNTPF